MLIVVTLDHIECGVPEDRCNCPIALAIKEQIPGVVPESVDVDQDGIQFNIGSVLYNTTTPPDAVEFISAFDSDDNGSAWDCWEANIEPFEFEFSWKS